jgi:hypothetical protein
MYATILGLFFLALAAKKILLKSFKIILAITLLSVGFIVTDFWLNRRFVADLDLALIKPWQSNT